MHRFPAAFALLWITLWTVNAAPASATADPAVAALCDHAGQRAAGTTGVPLPVLRAIALTETGRVIGGRHQPWPWTVNMEGKGKWFATREEAIAYVRAHHARGARSFDVGCFQINYRWHGRAFASIEEMFDPVANAVYAGRFLRDLHAETRSWSASAGAYHSRTPKYAIRYRARFDRILARLTGGAAPPPPAPGAEYAHGMTDDGDTAPTPRAARSARPSIAALPVAPPGPNGSLAANALGPGVRSLLTVAGQPLY